MPSDLASTPFADLELGDIVTFRDGRALTVRCRATLPSAVGSMAGFVLAGELELLLATPARAGDQVGLYLPKEQMPSEYRYCRTVVEGAARYWAPHLPALGGAMGEVIYRVVEIRGMQHPAVIIYRGEEVVVFVHTSGIDPRDLRVAHMPRGATEVAVTRHSGTLTPASVPVSPRPARRDLPAPAPGRKLTRAPSR